jgi:hypothetical protein
MNRTVGGILVPESKAIVGVTARGRPIPIVAGGSMSAAAVRDAQRATPSGAEIRTVPFVRGSREFTEGPFDDRSVTPGAAAVAINPIDVPARGWATAINILVEGSVGVLGAGALSEDWPFNVFDQLTLHRPNGDPYFGPLQGYSAFLTNLYGGYEFHADPRQDDEFLGTINCRFHLRIPMEITHHDGYGALINQDQAAPYRLSWTVPASTTLFPTAPTTIPALRYRSWLEGWEQPPSTDLAGNPIAQSPPGTPTAQFWSEQTFNIIAGLNTPRLTDVGNLVRCLIFIYRDDTAVRIRRDDEWPQDSLRITYAARPLEDRSMRGWKNVMRKHYGHPAPSGVIVYDKIHDGEGHSGNESRNQYLATADSTRIEAMVGTYGGSGGVLTVITNDVAPAGVPVT